MHVVRHRETFRNALQEFPFHYGGLGVEDVFPQLCLCSQLFATARARVP